MIRRGADKGQAERDVDAVIEGERLDLDQRLIVIHADGAIVGLARGGVEHGIRRQRAARVDAVRAQPLHRRRDDRLIFLAKRSLLAGMRVEAGQRKARPGDAEAGFHAGCDDARGLDDQVGRQCCDRLAQRQMDGHRHHGQRLRPQHHHRQRRPAANRRKFGEEFGVAGMFESGAVEYALSDRVGDNGAGATGHDIGDGVADRGDRGGGAALVRAARLGGDGMTVGDHRQRVGEQVCGGVGGCGAGVERDAEQARAAFDKVLVADQVERRKLQLIAAQPRRNGDVGPDAGRFAKGQCNGLDAHVRLQRYSIMAPFRISCR